MSFAVITALEGLVLTAFVVIPGLLLLAVARWILAEYSADRVPILLYHRLLSEAAARRGEVPDDEMIYVSYDIRFAEQMRYLAEAGFTTLDMDDYVRIRAGRQERPPRPVIVTFDDGYLSNYTMGFPVLRELGLKATIFVSPEPDACTRQLVAGVDGFVTAEQMREMAASGISIQSHTLTHAVLTELEDAAVDDELRESRRQLEAITAQPVNHIAIPRAGYDRRVRRRVEAAAYQTACCNNKGAANGGSDPLALPRIVIERDMGLKEFAGCLTPRGSTIIRIVGELKRLPERFGGTGLAGRVRRILYMPGLRVLFQTRNLKRVLALSALGYGAAVVWFFWHLAKRLSGG